MPPFERLKHFNVLLADDMFKVRKMMKNMLRQLGFENFHDAKDGEEAVKILATQPVDVVLCDWNMPHKKGIDVLEFVRSQKRLENIPFIMVTGEVSEDVVAEAGETEVDDYLVKPFTMEQLSDKLIKLLRRQAELTGIDRHLDQGRKFMTNGQLDKAKVEFMAALSINSASPRTLYEIAMLYKAQDNTAQAINHLEKAVKISPKYIKASEAMAAIYEILGDKKSQIKCMKHAAAVSPRNLKRRVNLGKQLIEVGDKEGARDIYAAIMKEADPDRFPAVAAEVGKGLLDAGAWDLAEKALSKAMADRPQDLYLYNEMGIAYRRQGKYTEAIENYMKALDLSPDDENLHYNLARAYWDAGQDNKAVVTLQNSLRINPEFAAAKNLLGRISR